MTLEDLLREARGDGGVEFSHRRIESVERLIRVAWDSAQAEAAARLARAPEQPQRELNEIVWEVRQHAHDEPDAAEFERLIRAAYEAGKRDGSVAGDCVCCACGFGHVPTDESDE
jgi:hypothetical protein